jgi:hypothetical protein
LLRNDRKLLIRGWRQLSAVAHAIELQSGLCCLRLEPEITFKTMIEPYRVLRHGMQAEDPLCRFPGQPDGSCQDHQLLWLPLNQGAFSQPDRNVAKQREGDGETVKILMLRELIQSSLIELSGGMKRFHLTMRRRVLMRTCPRKVLELIGGARNRG